MPQATRVKKRRQKNPISNRPVIEPLREYSIPEAAEARGVSVSTVWRGVFLNQKDPTEGLSHHRCGRRVTVSGQQLFDWMAAGGKTGRSVEDLERERRQAEARRERQQASAAKGGGA
ncbi:MAG TPA: hypothetical protein VFD58_36475 [Blastocatellia bacterium]|nr:hypothetical protein [Blastocatellia bacterium]